MKIEEKLEKLKADLRGGHLLVAFSGGADSSLVAAVAQEVSKEAIAVSVDNGVMPSDCMKNAGKIAETIGIKHSIVKEDFLHDPSFKSNPPNRCYICKTKMYSKLLEIAENEGLTVVDGTNITDLLEDRPGIMVNYEKNIKSPLVKAGFTAEDVKNVLEMLEIDYSKSTTCLATRISKNSEITPKKINRIIYAESLLKGLSGSEIVRVRDQDGVALVELGNLEKSLTLGLLIIWIQN